MNAQQHRLTRSRKRLIGGVRAGIADYLGWSRTLVRVLYVIGSAAATAFPGILVYIVLWIAMPGTDADAPDRRGPP